MTRFYVVKVKRVEDSEGFVVSLAYDPNGTSIAEPVVSCDQSWALAKKLGAGSPQQLAGCFFDTEENDPLIALEYLLLSIKCKCAYIPPSNKQVLDLVAAALAKLQPPDLSNIDRETVFQTFKNLWGKDTIDPVKLYNFTLLVENMSKGKVKLSLLDPKIFLVQKPHAAYLVLTLRGGLKKQKLLMRPDIPIEFVD